MAVNPAIALGVKNLEVPDPLNQYSRIVSIDNARRQNELAQMQMRQAENAIEEQNRLRQFMPTLTAENRNQLLGYGESGRKTYESLLKGEKESREAEKAAADIAAARMKQARDLLPAVNTPETYANWRAFTLKNLPGLANVIPEQYSPEVTRNLMLEADKALEQHYVQQDLGGARQVVAMPKYGTGPGAVVPGTYATDVPMPPEIEQQKARIAAAGASRTNVNVATGKQEAEFEKELGKGQAKDLLESRAKAEDARDILSTVKIGRDILGSGAITGAGADFLIGLNQALKTAGVDMGYADAAANSQAYMANMANNVGRLIKQFGAGTGLSNADREYAEKMAGGRISLDGKALQRILDINERAARNVIKRHNKKVEGIKTNIPLAVDIEEAPAAKAGAESMSTVDKEALDWANANPKDPRAAKIKQRLGVQ